MAADVGLGDLLGPIRGRLVAAVAMQELLARGGRYAGFWAERSRARGWRLAAAA